MSSLSASSSRAAKIEGLKLIRCPEEGGNKKEYDDILEEINKHVLVAWIHGSDLSYWLSDGAEEPEMEEPQEEKKKEWKVKLWKQDVDNYGGRLRVKKENEKALYAFNTGNLSKMTKSKVNSTIGHAKAEKWSDLKWLMETLDDIMIGFERIKSPFLARDDQMEKIMRMKQKEGESNKDFINSFQREVKVYKKHSGKCFCGVLVLMKRWRISCYI